MTAFVDLFGGVLDSNTQNGTLRTFLAEKLLVFILVLIGARSAEHLPNICGIFTTIKKPRYVFVSSCRVEHQLRCPRECCLLLCPPPLPKNRRDSCRARSDAEVRDIGVQYSPDSEELLSTHISDTRRGGVGWGRVVIVMGSTQTLTRNQEEEARGR